MVSRLQMKLKDKIGVAGIFALGFFVVIASSRSFQSQPAAQANTRMQLSEPTILSATRPC